MVNAKGTVEGESNFNVDLSAGTFICNGKLGKTGAYKVNVKGGKNLFLLKCYQERQHDEPYLYKTRRPRLRK